LGTRVEDRIVWTTESAERGRKEDKVIQYQQCSDNRFKIIKEVKEFFQLHFCYKSRTYTSKSYTECFKIARSISLVN
jgi:hypothetical protein